MIGFMTQWTAILRMSHGQVIVSHSIEAASASFSPKVINGLKRNFEEFNGTR